MPPDYYYRVFDINWKLLGIHRSKHHDNTLDSGYWLMLEFDEKYGYNWIYCEKLSGLLTIEELIR